jgi:hypothetical protein
MRLHVADARVVVVLDGTENTDEIKAEMGAVTSGLTTLASLGALKMLPLNASGKGITNNLNHDFGIPLICLFVGGLISQLTLWLTTHW